MAKKTNNYVQYLNNTNDLCLCITCSSLYVALALFQWGYILLTGTLTVRQEGEDPR